MITAMQTLDYASFGILHFICKREDSIQTVLKTGFIGEETYFTSAECLYNT